MRGEEAYEAQYLCAGRGLLSPKRGSAAAQQSSYIDGLRALASLPRSNDFTLSPKPSPKGGGNVLSECGIVSHDPIQCLNMFSTASR